MCQAETVVTKIWIFFYSEFNSLHLGTILEHLATKFKVSLYRTNMVSLP